MTEFKYLLEERNILENTCIYVISILYIFIHTWFTMMVGYGIYIRKQMIMITSRGLLITLGLLVYFSMVPSEVTAGCLTTCGRYVF